MTKALRMNINRKCNLSCDYCYIELTGEKMSMTSFIRLLDESRPEQISLSGGEPFLHPNLAQMIVFAITHGVMRINIVTNGTYLKKRLEEFRKVSEHASSYNAKVSLSISVDAVQKQQSKLGPILNTYRSLGFRLRAYVYPDTDNWDSVKSASLEVRNYFDQCQILFPVPIGLNVGSRIDKPIWSASWKELHSIWSDGSRTVIVQRGFSDEPHFPEFQAPDVSESIFVDYDERRSECCLLSEIERQGMAEPNSRCKVSEGEGCLAIKLLEGDDWRFMQDSKPPCPLLGDVIR